MCLIAKDFKYELIPEHWETKRIRIPSHLVCPTCKKSPEYYDPVIVDKHPGMYCPDCLDKEEIQGRDPLNRLAPKGEE